MSRFKQVWLSFWRKNQGLGMMETALFLPIFLMFTFVVMDFGNYLIIKQRIVSANQAIASAIQNNPTMTVSDLNVVIKNSLGDLDKIWTGTMVSASKTPPSLNTMPITGAWWEVRNFTNPWLSDGDSSNDNNAYYVGVYTWRGVPFLTPLPKMLGLSGGEGFFDTDNRDGDAPNGRKGAPAFTFVTLNNASCPDGQVLQSTTSGSATCVARDNNYSCPDGQFLTGITNGVPYCAQVSIPAGTHMGHCVHAWGGWGAGNINSVVWPSKVVLQQNQNQGESPVSCGCEDGWKPVLTGTCNFGDCAERALAAGAPNGELYFIACIKN
jgi:hypothetical protein